jgi:glycosyltransferase involved in cell wall biosynthesis
MARKRDLFNRDASTHAASELEYIIRSDKQSAAPKVRKVTAASAMREDRVVEVVSSRDVTRVLFISCNTELLNPLTQSLDGYVNIRDLFAEVHILILRPGIPPKNPVLRVAPNVWLYTASAAFWWQTPSAGLEMLANQLEFAAGFRPDLIVARDPFESALVAIQAGKKYQCATQLHIVEDYSTRDFAKRSTHNYWRLFFPIFTIPRFLSVRTLTDTMLARLQKKFVIPDADVLPRFQDYESLIELPVTLGLKEKYKPLIFFMLYVGSLGHESTCYRALDAARFALQNQRVGLIVLGDGSARSEFEKRAKILGVEQQVIFETRDTDVIPYLKSANLLIVTDTDAESEEMVLRGAAAGVPMVMSRTDKREDIFDHGESAFLCEASDVQAFTDRINDLLNDVGMRQQFIQSGQDIIRRKFHSNPRKYQESYRASIEQALFAESDEAQKTKE